MAFRGRQDTSRGALLPYSENDLHRSPAISAQHCTKVALRIRYLVQEIIPVAYKESHVTKPNSRIITSDVIELVRTRAGVDSKETNACVVYALLMCRRWFMKQSKSNLPDADLNNLRAVACDVLAKQIIDTTDDVDELFKSLLFRRYSMIQAGEETDRISGECFLFVLTYLYSYRDAQAAEAAIDQHVTYVIGANNFQRCITYLWRGYWEVDSGPDGMTFTPNRELTNTSFRVHLDGEKIKTPRYQTLWGVITSAIFLLLYTIAVNTPDAIGQVDVVEIILYVFVIASTIDEFAKLWKVGRFAYLAFWNVWNLTTYTMFHICLGYRVAAAFTKDSENQLQYNLRAYQFLAAAAPLMWTRMLLYLDTSKFFGTMLIVTKEMLKESVVFFALLAVVAAGFIQSFLGLDSADQVLDSPVALLHSIIQAVLQSPDFDTFRDFAKPFGPILYYLWVFVTAVILLNILVALFNVAYSNITDNSTDEFLALFSRRTLNAVRAPDENVFLAPFNLVEVIFLLPLQPLLSRSAYQALNRKVIFVLYFPFLCGIAYFESRFQAKWIQKNMSHGEELGQEPDEDWEGEDEFAALSEDGTEAGSKWKKMVKETAPNPAEQ
ncbi:Calcium channel yvc1 [Saitoella coloradoensis]